MNTFSITESALAEIHDIIRVSGNSDSVVTLQDVANPRDLLNNSKKAFMADADHKKFNEFEGKEFEIIEEQQAFYLDVAVYEREICQPELLIEINGVMFVMASYIFEALRDYCLIFDGDHFILKSTDDSARNLLSVIVKWGENESKRLDP